jgi:glycosyltransferase involved in cell wall biosynthesis
MKRKHSAGYFSSYDRGLHILLTMWPAIRKAVPDATLDIYYGWNIFDNRYQNNKQMMQVKATIVKQIGMLSEKGVREHGRVGHAELAKAMKDISVWLYPTEFPEINCITALKTASANMDQVCTDVGALPETAPNATFIHSQHIYSDKGAQQQFVDAAIFALENPKPSPPPHHIHWPDIAAEWQKVLEKPS